ncbi:catechol 2,3-dioxygenase-like lactoylglutathione lyase family enzyme [Caulobacter ginsengisoli]|uniref:Catechol 2,3-dioxygenase-like lactoylglutathione lyase family enzyme n=1 Tax=Caulobacter ginsengisoli TaxID=400775 RepID=A0ABU0IRZ3_9CAUL|nr:VOC family protein [Caulobacter ginsengisoli]MDQ0464780.1 catechol 2,3-dioxygenase-like lactoylglutathione lyase family enzyme [Caulobacter ginsengisoli]
MPFRRSGLIDRLHIHTRDVAAAKRFYRAVMGALGVPVVEGEDFFFADQLWIDAGERTGHVHLAFNAADPEMVDRFQQAGLAAGGRSNASPEDAGFHPGHYAVRLMDPDGNLIEAVWRGCLSPCA